MHSHIYNYITIHEKRGHNFEKEDRWGKWEESERGGKGRGKSCHYITISRKKRKEFLKDPSIVFCVLVVNLALDFKL